MSDKFINMSLDIGGFLIIIVSGSVQVTLESVNFFSWVVAGLLPVEHVGLFSVDSFVLEFLLGNPEFNSEGFVREDVALVEVLDSELG